MAQPAAAAMEAALAGHDRIKKSSELPRFYGNPAKDTISARNLINRIAHAAQIAGWNTDARKLNEFYLILREGALVWWNALQDLDININSWAEVSTNFLENYEPKFTAKTTCTNFQDLVQRNNENV